MNPGNVLRRANSWHWLGAVAAVSLALSVFMPRYGWRDVFEYRKNTLEARTAKARERLDRLKSLTENDVTAAELEKARLDRHLDEARKRFASYGFEKLPNGEKAVFIAQNRIGAALAARNIRIISNEASISTRPGTSVNAGKAGSSRQAKQTEATMTAEEFKRQSEAAAAKITDRAVREMFIADARRKLAAIASREKRVAAKEKRTEIAKPRTKDAPMKKNRMPSPVRSSGTGYLVQGMFSDFFMFLVGETHRRANHSLSGISAVRQEDGTMDFAFTLKVDYK